MGARNVGGIRARSGRRQPRVDPSYLTTREAAAIARAQREKEQARGIFRRWNDRKLTPAEEALAAKTLRPRRRRLKPKP